MGKKYKRLFDKIICPKNFQSAYLKTRKNKRKSVSYLEFKEYGQLNLELLRQEVADGAYVRGDFRNFYIFDPKMRLISGLPFRDRVVQHALNNIIEPIYVPRFLPYTFACLPNKGTHAGIRHVQSNLRKSGITHYLKTDFSKYFYSIDCQTLYQIHDKKIHCDKTMSLMESIQPRTGVGIVIGSLKSQLNANLYGTMADDFVHHNLRPIAWARYMDDMVLLDNDPQKLIEMKNKLEDFANNKMKLQFSKWSSGSVSKGVNFLGYRIWSHHKLLRKQSVIRAKRAIKSMKQRGDIESLNKFLPAWTGHARWADVNNLIKAMRLENDYQ